MPKKQSEDYTREGDEKQRTDKGLTIPVPDRKDFLRNMRKVAPTREESEQEPSQTPREE
jgi:hypothetical protein